MAKLNLFIYLALGLGLQGIQRGLDCDLNYGNFVSPSVGTEKFVRELLKWSEIRPGQFTGARIFIGSCSRMPSPLETTGELAALAPDQR